MRFAKLLPQLASMRDRPPQGLSWLHREVQPRAELFAKGHFELDCMCRAQATQAGIELCRPPQNPREGQSLGFTNTAQGTLRPPSFHPPPAMVSAASSIKRRLKIRAGSTSPARTALKLFVPHPSSTSGCFTYQLLQWKFPLAGCELKPLLSNLQ